MPSSISVSQRSAISTVVGTASGHGRERLLHLLVALQEELVGVEPELGLLERRLRLDAEQRRVVVVVLAPQVVDVAGRDQRPADLARELDDALVRLVLLGDPVDLDLHVDVVRAERLEQVVQVGPGVGRAVLDEAPAEAGLEAAGERDQARRVALEHRHVDVGLAAAEALEEAGRAQLDEVAKALVRGREERQVVALGAAVRAPMVVDEIRLEPEDRLDPRRPARLVVLDRAVHHAVVGEAERRHPELGRPLGHRIRNPLGGLLLDLARPVEQRVLAVDVEVCDRSAHLPDTASGVRWQPGVILQRAKLPPVIWLLRHGEAEDIAADDASRRLTEKGERQSRTAGLALAKLGVELDACLTSPKVRALDTARLACEALGESRSRRRSRSVAATSIPKSVAAGRGNVLLVGHEPDFSRAIQRATGARVEMKKGGLAAIDDGLLVSLMRPRQVREIAG